jgi:hypothetical protein
MYRPTGLRMRAIVLGAVLAAVALAPRPQADGALKQSAPARTLWVAITGSDATGDGTANNPYATIQFALDTAGAMASDDNRVIVRLGNGFYDEAPIVPDYVYLAGADPADPTSTVIHPPVGVIGPNEGVVVLGEQSRLLDVTVHPPFDVEPNVLVEIHCASARVDNVILDALYEPFTTGIRVSGEGSDGAAITRCQIIQMDIGIETVSSRVTITRNVFDAISVAALNVVPVCEGNRTPRLGDSRSPATTGFNQFLDMGGAFITMRGDATLRAELNDWGVYDAEAVAGGMQLAAPESPAVNLLYVTLEDERSGAAITNATIEAAGQTFAANGNGIYELTNIPAGAYTACVAAPGYISRQIQGEIFEGVRFLNFTLTRDCSAGAKDATDSEVDTEKGNAGAAIDFEPFLAKGQLAIQPSVLVTVLNDADSAPVLNASVALSPGLIEVRNQVDGVYPFTLVPPGNYTVTATAEGIGSDSVNVNMQEGQAVASVTVRLGAPKRRGCGR